MKIIGLLLKKTNKNNNYLNTKHQQKKKTRNRTHSKTITTK